MAQVMVPAFDLWSVTRIQHPGCVAKYPADQQWKCVLPQYILPELSKPWFMNANRFDMFVHTTKQRFFAR